MTSGDPLALDPEEMRRLGHLTVDLLVDRLTDPGADRALRRATPEEMRAQLSGPPPAEGTGLDALLRELWEDVLPYASRCEHPRYFAFIPANGTWPGALADFIAAALNPYVGSWMEAAGPSQVELDVLRWFAEWIGYPPEAAGILVSGGSHANLTALACAREARLGTMSDGAVLYVADQAHSSLARAARLLGFQPHQVRVLPADRHLRMDPGVLARAFEFDRRQGRTPLLVTAVAGATNTGAVDPLPEVADVCAEHGVWLHVDAAYGGFATLTERGRAALAGIERADSVTLDPHKWLYQPFECGSVLIRDGAQLRAAFEITPDYLRDAVVGEEEVNFADRGLQLSRGFRALKVWLSVRAFGTRAFAAAIDRCLDLALAGQARIEAEPELELLSPAQLGVVCFRRRPPGVAEEAELDRVNSALVAAYAESGEGLVSSTRLHGVYAIRLCILNHTSTAEDVESVLDWFARSPLPQAEAPRRVGVPERHSSVVDLGAVVAGPPPVPRERRPDPAALRSVPLLSGLDDGDLAHFAAHAAVREAEAGEVVFEQWSIDRDFYVVLEGNAGVERDGREVEVLGPGSHFGELAALEWGAHYAYARTATITARTRMRLAVVGPDALAALLVALPPLERGLAASRRERLRGLAAG